MNDLIIRFRRLIGGSISPRRSAGAPEPILDLRCEVVAMPGHAACAPPSGKAWIYDLAPLPTGEPFYVGQTCSDPFARLSRHIGLAQRGAGRNRKLEARLRRMAENDETLVLRLVDLLPAGTSAAVREQSRITTMRERLGAGLLNLASRNAHPVDRLVLPARR
ncbi:hypothetical protein [Roseomonas sp. WA12]